MMRLTAVDQARKRFLSIDRRKTALDADHTVALKRWQALCSHPNIFEVSSRAVAYSDHGGSAPPERVCADCGLHEIGWSFTKVGRGIHATEPPQITRDRLLTLRRRTVVDDE
jgi:hypothetical protein